MKRRRFTEEQVGYPRKPAAYVCSALDKWAYENQIAPDLSRPGKPTDNPCIESFNGRFRDECLNTHWFLSLDDANDQTREEFYREHKQAGNLEFTTSWFRSEVYYFEDVRGDLN